jgi:hypothetical protein
MATTTTVYFRLLVREKAKIHRSHESVFNGLVVVIQGFAESVKSQDREPFLIWKK